MQVKKEQLEPDMEQQTGSKLGKEYVKAVCCHPAYLTYMQSRSPAYGILQARILEQVAISSPGESSWPRDQTHIDVAFGQEPGNRGF